MGDCTLQSTFILFLWRNPFLNKFANNYPPAENFGRGVLVARHRSAQRALKRCVFI